MSTVENFTFIVLAYNHEQYILEHLESVKYIVLKYGVEIDVDIVISDDGSKDKTVSIINFWLERNSTIFRNVVLISDGKNTGTCKSFVRTLDRIKTEYCKVTAGDDIYSYENIFIESGRVKDAHILSGLPLKLINGVIVNTNFDLFNLYATNIIYSKNTYLKRLQGINFFNSPSIIYNTKVLLDISIKNFIEQFLVTEDYPLQIKMAEIYSPVKFVQVDKIFVYYRRTMNSAYIVKNTDFNKDKNAIFNYLINSEISYLHKMLLRNRLYCFNLSNKWLKKFLNISFYIYGFSILKNFLIIVKKVKSLEVNIGEHQKHYDLMASRGVLCYADFSVDYLLMIDGNDAVA